jgi:predicted transcriptional regulator
MKKKGLHILISDKTKEKLKQLSEKNNRSMANMIEILIQDEYRRDFESID